jgi:hypothetical protein
MSTIDGLREGAKDEHGSGGDNPGQGHTVTIEVDGKKFQVRPGKWIVSDLKAAVGVDVAKVLAEITPHGLTDLDDNGKIEVHEHQRFMSHARSGASS